MQLHPHEVAAGPREQPILALALAVGSPNRDGGLPGPGDGRMDRLRPVVVADKLEVLRAAHADADGRRPHVILLAKSFHLLESPRGPRAHNGVDVPMQGQPCGQRRHLVGRLPSELAAVPHVPREAPLEVHFVDCPSWHVVERPVYQPSHVFPVGVWAYRRGLAPGSPAAGMDGLAGIPVEQDSELLAPGLPQGYDRRVKAGAAHFHLHQRGEGIPRAGDVEPVVGMWSRCSIVEEPLVEHAAVFQPLRGRKLRRRSGTSSATGPEVAASIGAAEAE
mmetsp:Transcript_18580/g.51864  ORF Transcript_18580/g.51864 Transcript_18580/m.51864 type:complete len:277 (-) Transcript_18580:2020-2850(-)